MNEQEAAEALVAWARDVIPELESGYHYLSGNMGELPAVSCDLVEKRITVEDDRFPYAQLQQVMLRVFEAEVVFIVESQSSPGNPSAEADRRETEKLREFGAVLEAKLLDDVTLGDRVQMASEIVTFNYRLPFVQLADGTRGRQMTLNMAVAELTQGRGGV